jgi:molybdopterin biosynthesis enzyme
LFVTPGTALAVGVTVSVMLFANVPVGADAGVVQVTTWPAAAHVQLFTPVADTNVSPAGSVSVTVIGVVLGTPVLDSEIV